MIGILFKGEKIITSAHAIEKHTHYSYEIYGLENHDHDHNHDASDIWGFDSKVRDAVNSACSVNYGIISC